MTTQPETKLVTKKEQLALEQIAKGEAPHSQRAMALLALHEGNTQAQAAEKAGLSAGQVKYWTSRFRKQRLGIFPNDPKDGQTTKDVEPKLKTEKVDSAEVKSKDTKDGKGKKGKKKKKKKDKKSKKTKKKSGKAKKGKKSK